MCQSTFWPKIYLEILLDRVYNQNKQLKKIFLENKQRPYKGHEKKVAEVFVTYSILKMYQKPHCHTKAPLHNCGPEI